MTSYTISIVINNISTVSEIFDLLVLKSVIIVIWFSKTTIICCYWEQLKYPRLLLATNLYR